jgi:uncharacterized protein YjbI with pentapeptide repeats
MNKVFLLIICLILTSFTGCIEYPALEPAENVDEPDNTEERPTEQWTFYRDFVECDPNNDSIVAYGEFVDCLNMDLVNDGESVVAASSEFANEVFSMADLDVNGNLTSSEFDYIKNYPHEAEEECELIPYGHCSGEDLGGQDLSEINLTGIDLSHANLSNADLRNTNLNGADLLDARLDSADLTDANLTEARLRGAYLNGADLTNANLTNADLRSTNLCNTDLSDANLYSAHLYNSNLCGADLFRANLQYATLYGADLAYTDFTEAIVMDADFTNTYWEQTVWTDGVAYDENQA